jgi:hypothetical protein
MADAQRGLQSPPGVDIGPFSKIPNRLFGSGTAAILGTSATLLFVALCEHANRNSSNIFSASDRALAADTGLSPRTICEARKALQERSLLSVERMEGRSYSYTLLKRELGWVPVKDRQREKRKPRALHAGRVQTIAKFAMVQETTPAKFAMESRKLC